MPIVRYLSNEDMRAIAKGCPKIEALDLSGCDSLDQGIFKHISKLSNLRKLAMNSYQQPFGDLQCMKALTSLKEVSVSHSCIVDLEGVQLVKELESLQQMNINGCQLLTDTFLTGVMAIRKYHQVKLTMEKTKFGNTVLREWEELNNNNNNNNNKLCGN
jgi:hypothetical protein